MKLSNEKASENKVSFIDQDITMNNNILDLCLCNKQDVFNFNFYNGAFLK